MLKGHVDVAHFLADHTAAEGSNGSVHNFGFGYEEQRQASQCANPPISARRLEFLNKFVQVKKMPWLCRPTLEGPNVSCG